MIHWRKRRLHLILFPATITISYLLCSSQLLSGILNTSHFIKDGLFSSTQHSSSLLNKSHFTKDPSIPYVFTFGDSKRLPFFYKPLSSHANDIYREKNLITVNSPLKQDLAKSKLIVFFNMPSWIKEYYMPYYTDGIQKCPVTSCELSDDLKYLPKADAVIMDGVYLIQPNPPVKYPNQVWIFYGIEPLPEYSKYATFRSDKWRSLFNWTMTYRLDSDIVTPYSVLARHTIKSKKNFTEIALSKTKSALWLVSHCETQSKREEYVRKLNEYYPVDIYGRCGSQRKRDETDFNTLLKDYRFYLSFENAFCDDYVSEKLFRLYNRDLHIIPVVRGRVKYDSLFPSRTFLNTADFTGPRKLAEYLNILERNVTAYAEMLSQKDNYIQTGDLGKLTSPFCDVCIKLHNLDIFSNHYPNVSKWLEEGICQPPDDY